MVTLDCMGCFRKIVLALTNYYVRKSYSIDLDFLSSFSWVSFLFQNVENFCSLSQNGIIFQHSYCSEVEKMQVLATLVLRLYWLFLRSQNNEWIREVDYFCLNRRFTILIHHFLAKKGVCFKNNQSDVTF